MYETGQVPNFFHSMGLLIMNSSSDRKINITRAFILIVFTSIIGPELNNIDASKNKAILIKPMKF